MGIAVFLQIWKRVVPLLARVRSTQALDFPLAFLPFHSHVLPWGHSKWQAIGVWALIISHSTWSMIRAANQTSTTPLIILINICIVRYSYIWSRVGTTLRGEAVVFATFTSAAGGAYLRFRVSAQA